ncbi:MAG TPA: hypothetical protein VKB48_12030 [Candidatus Acidoferrum sp.]|nr:hypothetical protein [Candidatus Acidoferrum sp.]
MPEGPLHHRTGFAAMNLLFQEVLVRTAHAFLRGRHLKKCPVRFDVVAIDTCGEATGTPPAQGRP